jgi:hypothetical protein
MKLNRILAAFACTVTAIAAASMAHADGSCNAYRDTTAAERATMNAILEAAKKTLAPAPAGWMLVGDDKVSAPSSLCRDNERDPWNYAYTRHYQNVGDQDARNKMIADEAATSAAAMKTKQPRLDAAMARITKLTEQQVALMQKGDAVGAEALDKEMAKAQAEYEKILKEGDSEQRMSAVEEKFNRDREMTITVQINASGEIFGSDAKNLPLPPGARAAVHWIGSGRKPHEDRALILVGQWAPGAEGHWQPVRRAGIAVQGAHVISVSVVADSERLTPALAAIDFNSLAAALK